MDATSVRTAVDVEAQLSQIIAIARAIAATGEELIREYELTQRVQGVPVGTEAADARLATLSQVAPRILAASAEQLSSLLEMLRR